MLSVVYKNGNLIDISFCLLEANSLFLLHLPLDLFYQLVSSTRNIMAATQTNHEVFEKNQNLRQKVK